MTVLDTLSIELEVDGDSALQQLIGSLKELTSAVRESLGVTSQLGAASGKLAQGVGQAKAPVEQATQAVSKQSTALQVLRENWRALLGLGIGTLIGRQLSDLTNQAVSLDQTARALGVTTRGFQALGYAAEQSSVPMGAVESALKSLQDTARGAAMGDNDAMQSLGFLGLSGRALSGMDAPARFAKVAEALSRIKDPARRAGVAMRVFGGDAQALMPLIAQGSDGIQKLTNEFVELGGGLSGEQIKALTEWNRGLSKLSVTWTRFRGLLAQTVLPVLNLLADGFQSVVKWLSELDKKAHVLEYGGIAVLIGAFMKLFKMLQAAQALDLGKSLLNLRKWVGIGLIIAAIAAVVEDLIHLFRGGRSVFAEVVDKFLGLGKVDGWVRNIKAGFEAMSNMEFPGIQEILDAFTDFYKGDELRGAIAGLEIANKNNRIAFNKEKDPRMREFYDKQYKEQTEELKALQHKYFGIRGLRAVGRGVNSDVQRSGELTTGSLSRNEGGLGSVTIQNQIKIETQENRGGSGQTAREVEQGVNQAMKKTARDIQAASGGRK